MPGAGGPVARSPVALLRKEGSHLALRARDPRQAGPGAAGSALKSVRRPEALAVRPSACGTRGPEQLLPSALPLSSAPLRFLPRRQERARGRNQA